MKSSKNQIGLQDFDPVRLELIKNGVGTIVDEMVLTMVRIAYSSIIKHTMDVSSAICDRNGEMIAQGLSIPLHLGSFPDAMESVREVYGNTLEEGDVVILNDPYRGGMHLPDIFLFRPIFVCKRLLGYAVVVAHHNDVGGRVPGSSAADSTEIYQEGLRIPPLKLIDKGIPNINLFEMIELNTRVPDMVMGDLQAQIVACETAEKAMQQLAEHYGIDELERYFGHLIDYTERATRRAIETIPDGTYTFEDFLDDDGITPDRPVPIRVTITSSGSDLSVSFDGTSPQVAGAINATMSFAKSAVYFAVRCAIGSDMPNNAGFFRPVHVTAPYGCLVNPKAPAAVAARGVSGFRIIDAMFAALAKALPERIRAAGEGGITSYSVASYNGNGTLSLFREVVTGTWGGAWHRDGVDGVANPAANMSNAPIELVESQAPILVERYELVPDSGGAGRWRGGLAVERQLRFLEASVTLQLRSDRRNHQPYGLAGGAHGAGSSNHLDEGEGWRLAPTKFIRALKYGDRLRHRTAGGGGYGDPYERLPDLVLRDVRDGKVTIQRARADYGVAVLNKPLRLDHEETARLRAGRDGMEISEVA